MWNNPGAVVEGFFDIFLTEESPLTEDVLADKDYFGFIDVLPDMPDASEEMHLTIKEIYDSSNQIVRESFENQKGRGEGFRAECTIRLRRHLVEYATRIEKEPSLLLRLYKEFHRVPPPIGFGSAWLSAGLWIALLHLLVGDERNLLVGCSQGKPLWKRLPTKVSGSRAARFSSVLLYSFGRNMPYLRPEDVDLIPDEIETYHIRSMDWEEDPEGLDKPVFRIRSTIEDAYYNQRYVVDPRGAYVKLEGCRGVKSMILKTRKSISDPNFIDFIAQFETGDGICVVVLDGTVAVKTAWSLPPFDGDSIVEEDPRFGYFEYLIALIYHDLVTAKEIRVRKSVSPSSDNSLAGIIKPVNFSLPGREHWVYIPRVIKNVTYEPRNPVASPRICQPHKVTGHLRKANMSEEHKLALQEFEKENNILILRFVPEGYTFVRPHVSPKVDGETLTDLPKFIRRRVQQDIESMMVVEK